MWYAEVRNQRGRRTHYRHHWTLHEVLQGSTEAALDTAMATLESDYRNITGDVKIKHNDGTIAHQLPYASTINGFTARVTYPGYFPGQWGSHTELYNLRYVVIQLTCDILSVESEIAFYWSSVSHNLGGFDFRVVEAFTGPPQVQLVKQQSKFWAVQSGKIIGTTAYINPPASYWPAALMGRESWWKPETPQFQGRVRNLFFPYSWSYRHESPFPLFGIPNSNP